MDRIGGDPAARVSMYDLGAEFGMDKETARRTAETLMSDGYLEVRTLSGGIGITQDGIDAVHRLRPGTGGGAAVRLGDGPVISEQEREAVETLSTAIKTACGESGLSFDALAELITDLRTIDAQLASPKPKTAIIRACFASIRSILHHKTGIPEELPGRIQRLIGD